MVLYTWNWDINIWVIKIAWKLVIKRIEELSQKELKLKLSKIPGPLLERLSEAPGTVTPFFYIGAYGSSFALHAENLQLFSASYLIQGASKIWIVINRGEEEKLEKLPIKISHMNVRTSSNTKTYFFRCNTSSNMR